MKKKQSTSAKKSRPSKKPVVVSKPIDTSHMKQVKIGSKLVQPLGDRVLVRQSKNDVEKTASGIYIPDTLKKEKPEEGIVIAVGDGRREEGKLIPLTVAIGDTVVFSKYGYDEIKIDGEDYLMVKEDSILAIVK